MIGLTGLTGLMDLTYAVIFSQVVVLYWLAAPTTLRLMYRSYLNKNPAWVAANPGFAARYAQPAYAVGLCAAVGLGWIAFLVRGLLAGPDNAWLVGALMLPMLAWLALELAIAGIEYRRVCKRIPLPDRRRASLQRRTLSSFIHPAWILPGLGLLIVLCSAYMVAYCHELIEANLLEWRLFSLAAGSLIWVLALRHTIHRKKQAVDEALGPGYRKSEVFGTVACLYLFILAAAFRALQELLGVYLLADVAFFTGASLLLQVAVLFWISRKSVRKLALGLS